MIVVAAGSGSRFESDKMLTMVDGSPLVAVTVARVRRHTDTCVLVCRTDQEETIARMKLDVVLTVGGPTRTTSEIAGISALRTKPDLIGIHDGARPNVSGALIERLFRTAQSVGGAVPVLRPDSPLVDRETLDLVEDVITVQTPQVFRGPELIEAYQRADGDGYTGHDTVDVVQRYTDLEVASVDGDPANIKVTYPGDLARVIPL